MSRATFWAPKPNARAAASATPPSTINNVLAAPCPPMPSEGSEHRVDYDGDPCHGGQDVATGGTPDDPSQEVRQKRSQNQYQHGGYDVRDVGDKLSENRRDLAYAQSVSG